MSYDYQGDVSQEAAGILLLLVGEPYNASEGASGW